jgi:hypothetical protein
MSDSPDATNSLTGHAARSTQVGELPEAVRRRYLSERRLDGAMVFFTDATVLVPSFRDTGARLIATRSDPNIVGDLLAIAQHRGWTTVQVRGAPGFCREVWTAGRALGLDVEGYRPSERDEQVAARRLGGPLRPAAAPDSTRPRPAPPPLDLRDPRQRLRVVEAVVRDRVVGSLAQSRLMAAARERVAELQQRRDRNPQRTTFQRER